MLSSLGCIACGDPTHASDRCPSPAGLLRRLADATVALQVASRPDELVRTATEVLLDLTGARRAEATLAATAEPQGAPLVGDTGGRADAAGGPPLMLTLKGRLGQWLGELALHPQEPGFSAEVVALAVAVANCVGHNLENMALVDGLQEALQRKDRLLAALTRELQEPLTPLVHGASLLEHAAPGDPLVARARQAIAPHARRLEALLALVEDIRRVDHEALTLRRTSCTLETVMEAAADAIRPYAAERGVAVRVHLPPLPALLLADEGRLAQALSLVLRRLVAATATAAAGGTVVLEATQAQGRVRLAAYDLVAGPLLTPPPATRVTPDAQCAANDSLEDLGVALACRVVALHGGTLVVRGGGAGLGGACVMDLPCAPRAPVITPVPAPVALRGSDGAAAPYRLRVLVVDDNTDAADALGLLLTRDGHAVTVCYAGEGVAERHATDPYDVVFLDIGLPGMTGYEVARAIRRLEGDTPALLVALTGWGQPLDRRRSFEAGLDHHLVKPVAYPSLRALLALWERDRGGEAALRDGGSTDVAAPHATPVSVPMIGR